MRPQLCTSGSIQSNLAEDPSALCLSPTSLHRHNVSQIVFTQVHEQSQTMSHQKIYLPLNTKLWLILFPFLLTPSNITSDASTEMSRVSTFFLILILIKCLIKLKKKSAHLNDIWVVISLCLYNLHKMGPTTSGSIFSALSRTRTQCGIFPSFSKYTAITVKISGCDTISASNLGVNL